MAGIAWDCRIQWWLEPSNDRGDAIVPTNAETAFDRSGMARVYAKLHRAIDTGVIDIYHLPTDAPPREVRLLEVNASIPDTTNALEAIDFGVDMASENAHTLLVLDVTPSQWKAVLSGSLALPAGWTLEGKEPIPARRAR